MRTNKLIAAALFTILAMTGLPVSTVRAAEIVKVDEVNFPDNVFRAYVTKNYDKDGSGYLSDSEIGEVKSIGLRAEGISDLTGIEYFTALENIDCSMNELKSIDVSKNTALKALHCTGCRLTELDVSKNTALKELGCSSNLLNSLDVSNNTALTTLYCGNNRLTGLNVSNNTALTYFFCECNELTELDLSRNPQLSVLFAWGNNFTELDVSGISNLDQLKYEDDFKQYSVSLDKERKLLLFSPLEPDGTIQVGGKKTFRTKKKAAVVAVSDEAVASVKKKGKKVIVTGKSTGVVTVTASSKKGKELGRWIVKVE